MLTLHAFMAWSRKTSYVSIPTRLDGVVGHEVRGPFNFKLVDFLLSRSAALASVKVGLLFYVVWNFHSFYQLM
jgi:hypothetical protein